jgi:hypothetical protein
VGEDIEPALNLFQGEGVFNYEKNHPPPYPLPSRRASKDRISSKVISFKFDIKDVSKFLYLYQSLTK